MQKKETKVNVNRSKNRNSKSNSFKKNSGTQNARKSNNDPAWYSADAAILRDSASIPYSIPAGHVLPLSKGNSDSDARVPGVMALKLAPTIGRADDPTDPINMAATQSYAFIRHANSGSANYEAPDIMLYFLAMADVYSYIEYLKRMYGVVQVYAQRNKYIPYTLLHAMKVEPESLIHNLASFRLGLNMLINKAASFSVPNTMSIFPRRQFIYSGIYTEGSSVRDQLYLYVPDGFHVYNWVEGGTRYMTLNGEGVSDVLGSDVSKGWNEDMELFDAMTLLKIGHRMIDVIIHNEDLGIMNGDILKAYGENILKLSHISEDYVVAPVYDPAVLEQMQNATVMPLTTSERKGLEVYSGYMNAGTGEQGMPILHSQLNVKREVKEINANNINDASVITSNLLSIQKMGAYYPQMLTTMLPEPTPGDNMEITRLMLTVDNDGNVTCGTEICTNVVVYHHPYTGFEGTQMLNDIRTAFRQRSIDISNITNSLESSFVTQGTHILGFDGLAAFCQFDQGSKYLSMFKFRPHIYKYDLGSTLQGWTWENSLLKSSPSIVEGNFSNYTVLDAEVINRMHESAVLSLFATPHVAIKGV